MHGHQNVKFVNIHFIYSSGGCQNPEICSIEYIMVAERLMKTNFKESDAGVSGVCLEGKM